MIYRGVRMVNWDPKALTALSDEEVIYKEEHSKLYYLRYKVEGDPEGRYAVVATTRPETIMGDTAMCINPNDPKNQWLKGKKVIVPSGKSGNPSYRRRLCRYRIWYRLLESDSGTRRERLYAGREV